MNADEIAPRLAILAFEHDDVEMQEWLKFQLLDRARLRLLASPECLKLIRNNAATYSKIIYALRP